MGGGGTGRGVMRPSAPLPSLILKKSSIKFFFELYQYTPLWVSYPLLRLTIKFLKALLSSPLLRTFSQTEIKIDGLGEPTL